MDDPQMVFQGALDAHLGMIKTLRGLPGLLPERYQEALSPAHCALSLVGEVIGLVWFVVVD